MELIIHDKEAYQHSLEHNKILWLLLFRKGRRTILIQYLIGILFLVFGFLPIGDSVTRTEYVNNITHQTVIKTEKDSVNVFILIGIAYVLMISISLLRRRKMMEGFMDEVGYRGRIVYKTSNESTTFINEERIKYENPLEKAEWKWAAFLTFSLYKEYIILNHDRAGRSSFVIEMKLLPAGSYNDLLVMIRQKVQETKSQ